MKSSRYILAAVLSAASSSWAAAASSYVIGDSIGDGVAIASGQNNLAHIGIHIRGPKALAQIAQAPVGATAYIFLGTNDAESSIKNIEKSVDDVVAAADRRKLSVTWVGPHCVRKAWDARARQLDGVLSARLASTDIKYVSMRDSRICSGEFHEPDGVHLTMKGYRYMWELARKTGVSQHADAAAQSSASPSTAAVSSENTKNSLVGRSGKEDAAPARLVTEVHIPDASPAPIVWTKRLD